MTAQRKSRRKNPGPGRPPGPPAQVRDYRGNLLLDDKEEAVWRRILQELSTQEGREIKGAELLRRLCEPYIRRAAERFGMELNPPRPTVGPLIRGSTLIDLSAPARR